MCGWKVYTKFKKFENFCKSYIGIWKSNFEALIIIQGVQMKLDLNLKNDPFKKKIKNDEIY